MGNLISEVQDLVHCFDAREQGQPLPQSHYQGGIQLRVTENVMDQDHGLG